MYLGGESLFGLETLLQSYEACREVNEISETEPGKPFRAGDFNAMAKGLRRHGDLRAERDALMEELNATIRAVLGALVWRLNRCS